MAKVEFNYIEQKITILCNENDSINNIFQKFCNKVEKSKNNLLFIYNGDIINENKTFFDLANSFDKQRKVISIIVYDNEQRQDCNSELLRKYNEVKEKLNRANKIIEEQKAEIEELKYKLTMTKSVDMNQINKLMDEIEKKMQK